MSVFLLMIVSRLLTNVSTLLMSLVLHILYSKSIIFRFLTTHELEPKAFEGTL